MLFYINDLFVFEPTSKIFYSHEELIYKILTEPQNQVNLKISTFYLNQIKNNTSKEEEKTDDESKSNISTREIPILTQTQVEQCEVEWNQEAPKHNFELFLQTVDLKDYNDISPPESFFQLYLDSIQEKRHKLISYIYLRKKGFELESGSIFGFHYLLYKESEDEIGYLNKTQRTHSDYAVFIHCENSQEKYSFLDIQRKHRIAQNYKKKLLVITIKELEQEYKTSNMNLAELLNKYEITNTIYSISKMNK